jgi:5'-methylthioadenosine phosphorylase
MEIDQRIAAKHLGRINKEGNPMKIGVIGGSGLYHMAGLENAREVNLETPFGKPSDAFVCGSLAGVDLVFLARHGRGHVLLPSEINFKANIYGMKQLGVERILSVSAVGSFREEMAPRDLVLVDQFVDRTKRNLDQTFFGEGIVGHIGFADPVCEDLRQLLLEAARAELALEPATAAGRQPQAHDGGTYLNMEGPAFSTRAESRLYKSWGLDVIGMTNLAEAKLAREAEICYATLAMVTDYDSWHVSHEAVSVEMVVETLNQNAAIAERIVRRVLPRLTAPRECPCQEALATAVITSPKQFPAHTRKKLNLLLDKYYREFP